MKIKNNNSADTYPLYRPGVGVMLVNENNLVWVGLRIDRHKIKIPSVTQGEPWQMPQGGIDEGETVHDAMVRELEEEIGITPKLYKVIAEMPDWLFYDLPSELQGKLWGGHYLGQRQKWFLARFTGQDSDINIHTSHPEFDNWRWVKSSELISLIVPFKKDTYEKILNSFSFFLD